MGMLGDEQGDRVFQMMQLAAEAAKPMGGRDRVEGVVWEAGGGGEAFEDAPGGLQNRLWRNHYGSEEQEADLRELGRTQAGGGGYVKAHAPKDGGKHVHTTFGYAFKGGKGRNAARVQGSKTPGSMCEKDMERATREECVAGRIQGAHGRC